MLTVHVAPDATVLFSDFLILNDDKILIYYERTKVRNFSLLLHTLKVDRCSEEAAKLQDFS